MSSFMGGTAQRIYHENQILTAPVSELAVLVHAGACSSLRRVRNVEGRYSQAEMRAQLYRAKSLLYLLKDSLILQEGPAARKLYQIYDQVASMLETEDAFEPQRLDLMLEIMGGLQKAFEGIKKRTAGAQRPTSTLGLLAAARA